MAKSTSSSTTSGGMATGRTVVGMFRDRSDAEAAINALKRNGFSENQLSVAMRDPDEARRLGEDTATEAGDGATVGAVSGGLVGGTVGLLAGVGAIAIPGIGPAVAAGWLASTLVGAGVGAAAGGIIGGLVGMGIPEEDARRFDAAFREGGILVAVEGATRATEAAAILQSHRADVTGAGAPPRAHPFEADSLRPHGDPMRDEIDAAAPTRSGYTGAERRGRTGSSSYSGPERRQLQL